jgi:hypothetical protein
MHKYAQVCMERIATSRLVIVTNLETTLLDVSKSVMTITGSATASYAGSICVHIGVIQPWLHAQSHCFLYESDIPSTMDWLQTLSRLFYCRPLSSSRRLQFVEYFDSSVLSSTAGLWVGMGSDLSLPTQDGKPHHLIRAPKTWSFSDGHYSRVNHVGTGYEIVHDRHRPRGTRVSAEPSWAAPLHYEHFTAHGLGQTMGRVLYRCSTCVSTISSKRWSRESYVRATDVDILFAGPILLVDTSSRRLLHIRYRADLVPAPQLGQCTHP